MSDSIRFFKEVCKAISSVLDFEEGLQSSHGVRTGLVAGFLAGELMPAEANRVYYTGLLHHVGAMNLSIPLASQPIFEPERLSEEVLKYPDNSAQILRKIEALKPHAQAVLQHHEFEDGSGFPDHLRGDRILPLARIVSVASNFDWIYRREGGNIEETIRRIAAHSGGWYPVDFTERVTTLLRANLELLEKIYGGIGGVLELTRKIESATDETVIEPDDVQTDPLLCVFSMAIDSKYCRMPGRSIRMAEYASRIAKALGIESERMRWAALIHNVGKIGIPKNILDKKGRLSPMEQAQIRKHARDAIAIISSIERLSDLAEIAACLQEKYDGSGYPYGYRGEEIPIESRVMAIAESFDAMTTEMPHRAAMPAEKALAILKKDAGTCFDPRLVDPATEALSQIDVTEIQKRLW